jgi:molybdopterin synthase catalytic subunit
LIEVRPGVIDEASVLASVRHPGAGAVVGFAGTTRDSFDGRRVVQLAYEAHVALAVAELGRIRDEAIARWPGARVAIVHRLGEVGVAQTSVFVAASAPHRADAFDAARYAIDALKERAPIWKREVYEDGSVWKSNEGA